MLDYSLESHLYFWCKMQFTSYPFDKHVSSAICKGRIFEVCHFSLYVQTCKFRFGSYGYNDSYVQFYTRDIIYKQDSEEQATGLQYQVVSVSPLRNPVYKSSTLGDFSLAGFEIQLIRHSKHYILDYYIPTSFFVCVSWVSFLVPPDSIPGRMTLLITNFLVLVNIFNASLGEQPHAEGVTALSAWILFCILFVFASLAAYASLLYTRMRFKSTKGPQVTKETHEKLEYKLLKMDQWFLIVFPMSFLTFTMIYWIIIFSFW